MARPLVLVALVAPEAVAATGTAAAAATVALKESVAEVGLMEVAAKVSTSA